LLTDIWAARQITRCSVLSANSRPRSPKTPSRSRCRRPRTAPPYRQDIDLLIEALQLAAQKQQAEARRKLAVGLLVGAALAFRPWLVRG
jgi:hypothetical protein